MNKYGFNKLLTTGFKSPKLKKSDEMDYGFKSAIQYLLPHKASGLMNVCPAASPGCISACLNTAGHGQMNSVQRARLARTEFMVNNRKSYQIMLVAEIERFVNKCKKMKLVPALRLNGTSDLKWETFFPGLIETYREAQFYDYTKILKRMLRFCDGKLPANYHLTFSRSEENQKKCEEVLEAGGNVAVVFRKDIPDEWLGYPVFNADEHDLRFLDPKGIAGLKAKGKAKRDTSGFVVDV